MPIIKAADAPTFELPATVFTGLAAPSRGSTENSVWRVSLGPTEGGAAHSLDREEIFVMLAGNAVVTMDGVPHALAAGDALIVPAHTVISLANPGPEQAELVCVFPVGGKATLAESGDTITPPWSV